jgi:RNA polymerase sigma-70 factor (ECF subfamily)
MIPESRFERELLELRTPAWRLASWLLSDASRAEDAVQEAMLKAWRSRAELPDAAGLRPWLLRIVANTARNMAREDARRKVREEAMAHNETAAAGPAESAVRAEAVAHLRRAVSSLDDRLRLPVLLHCVEGLSHGEIARVLDMPEGTSRKYVSRGLEKLREALTAAGLAAALPMLPELLRSAWALQAPAALAGKLAATLGEAKAGASGGTGPAVNGGLLMKIGLGVAAAGLVAGATFWAVGGKTGEPAKSPPAAVPEKKSKFDTPVWHPDARWEDGGKQIGLNAMLCAPVDGPRQEVMSQVQVVSDWGDVGQTAETDPLGWSALDDKSERFHLVAGGARGYLDGPFSRARYGGMGYGTKVFGFASPDKRYVFTSDPYNGGVMRRLDFKEQMVKTVKFEGLAGGFSGATISKAGKAYMITAPNLLLISDLDGKLERKLVLEVRPEEGLSIGGWGPVIALDEKHNRLYASSMYDTRSKWHIWYWDLNANGAVHGEVAKSDKPHPDAPTAMFGGAPGSYKDGWNVYPEGGICFGPDDPDYRFLYTSRTDCGNFYRLDLEKKEVWAFSGPPDLKFIGSGKPKPFFPHAQGNWLPNGDFTIPDGRGLRLYRRIK